MRSMLPGSSLMIVTVLTAAALLTPPVVADFSHDKWSSVLAEFVDDRGRVDYQRLARERVVFDEYVAEVETTSPQSDPDRFDGDAEALAYYLNAYNALVFEGVLARGPEETSVWSGAISGYKFFAKMKFKVGGREMSLKKLEDDVIRAEFEDPRIHAALNCASLGCPRLPRLAFLPDRLDEQLDAAMTEFVNEERNCTVDAAKKTVTLSRIFDWFAKDFLAYENRNGNERPSVIDYVNRYREADRRIPPDFDIKFHKYDKRINKQ